MSSMKVKNKQFMVVSDFDINNHKLINVDNPTDSFDAVNKEFVDVKAINYALSTGLYSGGTISIASSSTFNIDAGVGFIVNPISKEIQNVTWDAYTGISLMSTGATDLTVSVGIDGNGDIVQQIPKFTDNQRSSIVVLGELFIDPCCGGLSDEIFYPVFSRDLASVIDFLLVNGPRISEGNNVIPNGNNLLLDVTAGKINGYSINALNSYEYPNFSTQQLITGITFLTTRYNGSEWVYTGSTNQIDPGYWSNGTTNLQPSTSSRFNLRIVFRSATDGDTFIISHPTQPYEYKSIGEAESELIALGVEYPDELFGITVPLCWIIIRGNALDLSDTDQARIIPIQSVTVAAGSAATSADNVSYDPTSSTNLESTDTQNAIEIINNRVESTEFSSSNLDMTALSGTSGVYLATNIAIIDPVYTFSKITINGVSVKLGDGSILADCFFSDDGGITPKNYNNITQGDNLYWSGNNASYQLELTDKIDFIYLTR